MTWVWQSSRSKKNARLLLLAIADCAAEDGTNAYPSVAELMRKTGLSERGVQSTLGDLVELGELKVQRNAGPGGCNRYKVVMAPAESAPPAEAAGAESAPPAKRSPRKSRTPQETTPTPAEPAPGTVLEPSEKISSSKRSSKPPSDPDSAEESTGQRVNRLARVYTDRVKLSNFNAIAGVVRKAVSAGVSDRAITHGLNVLADDMRSVTIDSLRYAIHGVPPSQFRQQAGPKPSTTDARVAEGLALAERLERMELPA